jgi:hypothetical protein
MTDEQRVGFEDFLAENPLLTDSPNDAYALFRAYEILSIPGHIPLQVLTHCLNDIAAAKTKFKELRFGKEPQILVTFDAGATELLLRAMDAVLIEYVSPDRMEDAIGALQEYVRTGGRGIGTGGAGLARGETPGIIEAEFEPAADS